LELFVRKNGRFGHKARDREIVAYVMKRRTLRERIVRAVLEIDAQLGQRAMPLPKDQTAGGLVVRQLPDGSVHIRRAG